MPMPQELTMGAPGALGSPQDAAMSGLGGGGMGAMMMDPRIKELIMRALMQQKMQGFGGPAPGPGYPAPPLMRPPGGRIFNPNSMGGPRG